MPIINHRCKRIAIALAGAVALCQPVVAAEEQSKGEAAFEVHVVVTDRGNAIFDTWDNPTGKSFSVDPIKIAPRGKFLSALVMFKNCKPDSAGNCNAVVDITAYDPKGKVYGSMPNAELWIKKPGPSRGYTQLSRSYMGIEIEPKDPIGTYRVSVVARDRVAKTEARSETTFQIGM